MVVPPLQTPQRPAVEEQPTVQKLSALPENQVETETQAEPIKITPEMLEPKTPLLADPELLLRMKFLRDKEFGLVTDPNEPDPVPNPIRATLQSRVNQFVDPFQVNTYGPTDGLRPTLDPKSELALKRMIAGEPVVADPFTADEELYNQRSREGFQNWLQDAIRVVSQTKNWIPFFNRAGAGAIKSATFGIVDTEEKAKDEVKDLGEQWLKESALPEFTGEITGIVKGGTALTKALGSYLGFGGNALSRFGAYVVGAKNAERAREAIAATEAAIQANKVARVGAAIAKGATQEGTLGAAIGLAREPGEGETRLDNAVHDALVFAGLGAIFRGGAEVVQIKRDANLAKAVTKLSEDLGISPVEAEGIIMSRTGAGRIKDVPAEAVEALPKGELKQGVENLKVNQGIVQLADRKNITLLEAAKEIQQKNPSAPIDLSMFRKADDAEKAVESYKDFVSKHIIGEVDGRTTFMPGHKFLENAGKWLYDTEGLTVAPGLKIKTVLGKDVKDIRRFLFGESSAAKDAWLADKRKITAASQSLQQDALRLIKDTEDIVPKIAKEQGVSESAVKQRLAQVFEGSVTQDQQLKYLGDQYMKVHGGLEKDLRELNILGDTRFLQKSRAQINNLISKKDRLIDSITKEKDLVRPAVQKALREREFASEDELKNFLSTTYGLKPDQSKITELYDTSRFLRSSYRNAGREHLGRYYEAHQEGRKAALGFYLKKNAGPQNLSRFKERLDLPEDVRESLGEIEDVTYRAGKTIYDQIQAVQRGKFQQAIARNPQIARPMKEEIHKGMFAPSKESERLIKEEGWVQIPKEEKWGDLSDHVVAPHVYDDLKSMGMTPGSMDSGAKAALDLYKKSLQAWKFGKVVLNPATHMRNMMSNSVLLDMSGLSFKEQGALLPKAAKELFNNGEIYQEARSQGLFGNEFISKEVHDLISSSLQKSSSHLVGLQEAFGKAASPGFIKRGLTKLGQIYQSEDQVFKLAKYMHARGQGYSKEVAAAEAEKWLFNYSDVPEAIRLAKDYYSPFISFVSKASPRFFETVIERPWKLAKYGIFFNALGNLGNALDETEDSRFGMINTLGNFLPDDMKRETYAYPQWRVESVLPEWAQTNLTSVGWPIGWLPEKIEQQAKEYGQTIPRLIRLPIKDKYGREQWLDLTYILPFGDLGEKGGASVVDIPRVLFPQHPLLDLMQGFTTNRDPFFGKPISFEGDPLKAQKYMQFIAKTMLPNLFPGGYSFDKLMAAIGKQEDAQGRLRSLPIALLDVALGLKVRPFDPDEEMTYRLQERERTIQDIQQEMKRLGVMYERKMISEEELNEKIDIYLKSIEEIAEDIGVLSNFGKK